MTLPHYAELFRTEAGEQIATINHLLLSLEADPSQSEPVEGIFRAVHTLKGASAIMGYAGVTELAHELEGVLERLRQRTLSANDTLIETLLQAADALEAGIERYDADPTTLWDAGAVLLQLRGCAAAGNGSPESSLLVRVQVGGAAEMPGVRAYLALRAAGQLGRVSDSYPGEDALQDPSFTGLLTFRLSTGECAETVRSRLLAVGELAGVEVDPPATGARDGQPSAAADDQRTPAGPSPVTRGERRHVRVDAERLDGLVEKLGELVILRDRLLRAASRKANRELTEPVDQLARLVGELREEMLELRLVRIGEIFQRFPRLVRDAARGLGKEVELVMEGEDLEIDRSLLEGLSEPLIHLLRNAVDHGIEAPAERTQSGKPAAGRVQLSAHRVRDRLWIRVLDDGRGIDRLRVLERARELGLVREDAARLADDELFGLLARPGFSTAERVTDVSGRGVGMDVVATQLRRLGGVLEVASRQAEGTSFTLKLPATVGLLHALLVRAAGDIYALPVAHVAETRELGPSEIHELGGQRFAVLREEVVPLISLGEVLGGIATTPAHSSVAVVFIEVDDACLGLEVDGLLAHQELVIKPFDAPRELLPLFSGATILADGQPALLLDAAALCRVTGASTDAQRRDHVTISVRA